MSSNLRPSQQWGRGGGNPVWGTAGRFVFCINMTGFQEVMLGIIYVGSPFLTILALLWVCLAASRSGLCKPLCSKCSDVEIYEVVGYNRQENLTSDYEESVAIWSCMNLQFIKYSSFKKCDPSWNQQMLDLDTVKQMLRSTDSKHPVKCTPTHPHCVFNKLLWLVTQCLNL